MSDGVNATYQDHRGYVATMQDGTTIVSLSLAGLRSRLPQARLVLDKRARQEQFRCSAEAPFLGGGGSSILYGRNSQNV